MEYVEINLDVSEVNVKMDKENDRVVLTDVYDGEIVHIEMYDLPELVEFLSRLL